MNGKDKRTLFQLMRMKQIRRPKEEKINFTKGLSESEIKKLENGGTVEFRIKGTLFELRRAE